MDARPDRAPDVVEISRRLEQLTRQLGIWVDRHRSGLAQNYEEEGRWWQSGGAIDAARAVRRMVRRRRARAGYFPEELFADPAWDILLELTAAKLEGVAVPISSLCNAAAVPTTTALRWINMMTDAGLLARRSDPTDRRRVFVELSPLGWSRISAYFAEVSADRGEGERGYIAPL